MRTGRLVLVLSAAAALAGAVGGVAACGAAGFDPQSKVDSVRMFAVRADKPFAKPGEQVQLEALMTDARKTKPLPAKLYWIPLVCMNPRDDLYYLCFAPQGDAGAQGGGATFVPAGQLLDAGPGAGAGAGVGAGGLGGGALSSIPTGVDLGPFLPQGPTFTFRMPDDAIQPRAGSAPYGLAIVFNIACAGSVTFAPRDPSGGLQQVPVKCADEQGQQLSPSDYVLGVSRVYSYADRTNANPVIEKVTQDGVDVDPAVGLTVDTCKAAKRADCKEIKIDVRVSDASWESNPSDPTRDAHEQIWADYYSDVGELTDDARLLFEVTQGRIADSAEKFHAPADPVDGTLWAVVHDSRGGVSWVVLPLHVR